MGRTILCENCKSTFDENVLANRTDPDMCPVCGKSLLGENSSGHIESPDNNSGQDIEKKTYYYYDDDRATLVPVKFDNRTPLYTFKATDMKDAERQLKEVCPNSPLLKSTPSKVIRCPRCFSTEYTLMNKGYSLFTGFLGSGRVKRVCNYCKKEF